MEITLVEQAEDAFEVCFGELRIGMVWLDTERGTWSSRHYLDHPSSITTGFDERSDAVAWITDEDNF